MKSAALERATQLIRRPRGTCARAGSRRCSSRSVSTNSVAPTAKIVLYSIEPGRHVAGAGRRDERGHRLGRLARVEGEVRLLARSRRARSSSRRSRARSRARTTRRSRRRRRGRRSASRPAPSSSRARRRRRAGRAARAHRVLGERRDGRDEHHAHHEPGGERVEDVDLDPDVAQERRHEREREVAVDDRRDAGEQSRAPASGSRAYAGAAYSLR